jgi:hypothetical protein
MCFFLAGDPDTRQILLTIQGIPFGGEDLEAKESRKEKTGFEMVGHAKACLCLFNRSWEASYTVEAAIIFSICLLAVGSVILLGLSVYQESISITAGRMEDMNVTKRFRLISAGKDILEQLK